MRIGAVAAITGGTLIVGGNIVHPRESGQLDDAETLLEVVAGSGVWVADHVLIMVAITLLLGAFYGLTHSITAEPGTTWARLGWGVAIVGVGLGVAFMATEAVALPEVASTWAASSGTEKDLALATGTTIFQLSLTLSAGAALFLFGIGPVLYGVALLGSCSYPSWLGWVGVIFGSLGTIAGIVQLLAGVTTLTGLVLVPISIVATTLWIIYLGVLMWRRSAVGQR